MKLENAQNARQHLLKEFQKTNYLVDLTQERFTMWSNTSSRDPTSSINNVTFILG